MLTAEALSYRHAGATEPALRGIDLVLADGEVVGLIGANDSGKSSLCLVLAGLAPRVIGGALKGRVVVDGRDAAELPTHELASRVGIVLDDPDTQRSGVTRTVYEEVAFGPSNLAVGRAELLQRTDQALELLGIDHLADRDPRRLSGGQQQLVAIASILAMRPRHLVLDEPTARLDPAGTELVRAALRRLVGQGASILVAEHKTDLLDGLADRIVVLDGGRVELQGPASQVLDDPRLPELGVASPARVRLARRLVEVGLDSDIVRKALAGVQAVATSGEPHA
jgi:energy-coupling factor transporter ATP-binding protein EcfA2